MGSAAPALAPEGADDEIRWSWVPGINAWANEREAANAHLLGRRWRFGYYTLPTKCDNRGHGARATYFILPVSFVHRARCAMPNELVIQAPAAQPLRGETIVVPITLKLETRLKAR